MWGKLKSLRLMGILGDDKLVSIGIWWITLIHLRLSKADIKQEVIVDIVKTYRINHRKKVPHCSAAPFFFRLIVMI